MVRGDTLSRIARAQGVTVDELRLWNGISGDLIEVGQVLVVGAPGAAATGAAPARPESRKPRKRARAPAASLAPTSDGPAPLAMPPEQPCLAGPTEAEALDDEAGFSASAGLSGAQVRAALRAFEPNLGRCLSAEVPAAGTAELELTVACTGRVAGVTLVDDGGLPDALVGCVRDTLGYAAFPPHDMPDGFTFAYPVTVSLP